MRVLGVDPGTRICGFACIELASKSATQRGSGPRIRNAIDTVSARGRPRLIGAGVVDLGRARRPIESRLVDLARSIDEWVQRFEPQCIALEEAFFGKSVQSALRLGEARGVVLLGAGRHSVPIHQYPPATIKMRVAGHGTATKEALARMVGAALALDLSGMPRDASDATAVALCHAWSSVYPVTPDRHAGPVSVTKDATRRKNA